MNDQKFDVFDWADDFMENQLDKYLEGRDPYDGFEGELLTIGFDKGKEEIIKLIRANSYPANKYDEYAVELIERIEKL